MKSPDQEGKNTYDPLAVLQQRDHSSHERHHDPIPAIRNGEFPGRTAQLIRAARIRSTTGSRPIRQGPINNRRLRPIEVRHANQARVRISIAAVPQQLRNVGSIAIIVAPADGVLLAETEYGERLVACARVVVSAVVVMHGVMPWVAVGAVEPETREEGEGAEGQEKRGHAEGGAAPCGVGDCCTTAVVAASAVCGSSAASRACLATEVA